MEIRRVNSEKECEICDNFLSKLINFEADFDNVINETAVVNNMYKNFFNKEYVFLAYAFEKEPMGYVYAYLKYAKGKYDTTNVINLETMFVDEKYRKKGIGKSLIKAVEDWAKSKFKDDFVIEITAIKSNINAVKFYKDLGYEEQKIVFRK